MDVHNDPQREPMYSEALITAIETYPSSRRTGFRLMIDVVWRRRWTGIVVMMTILAVMLIWTLKQPRTYRATAIVQIGPDDSSKPNDRSEEHTSELQSQFHLVC